MASVGRAMSGPGQLTHAAGATPRIGDLHAALRCGELIALAGGLSALVIHASVGAAIGQG